jgi:hypothetical protein
MIRIDKQEQIPEVPGVTVWGDDQAYNIYYALPSIPSFRTKDDGTLAFKYIKYSLPVPRPDGKVGGAYVAFDTEVIIPEAKLKKLKDFLQDRVNKEHQNRRFPGTPPPVQLGSMVYTRGTCNLLLEKDGVLVEKIRGAGKPSLYGTNVATFNLELPQTGAPIFEAAMQGEGSSLVNVVYDLFFWVKMPPMTARVWFNAQKFYSFYQKVDIDWNLWGDDSYNEKMHETFYENEAAGSEVNLNFVLPDPDQDKKLKDKIRDWAQRSLDDMVNAKMKEAITGVPEDKRKVPDGIEHLERNITVNKIQNLSRNLVENSAAEWNLTPQGLLDALTSLKDKAGKPLKWDDYAKTIRADDPFFKQLTVRARVNGDFQKLPIAGVKVHLDYPNGSFKVEGVEKKEYIFTKDNDVQTFWTFVEKDNRKYNYWYEVSYKNQTKTYKPEPKTTDEDELMVNVDDFGILRLNMFSGDIDYDQVKTAQLTLQYEDKQNGIALIQKAYTFDKTHPEQQFLEVIFQQQNNPFRYQIKYVMKDGKEYLGDWKTTDGDTLFVNDPWSDTETVTINASGNLDEIENIFVDLKYEDAVNRYTQTQSVVLNKENPTHPWEFPIINQSGKLTYSGTIKYKDGKEEDIAQTEVPQDKRTIFVGPKVLGFLQVDIMSDLLDFKVIKLAKISLQYTDTQNGIDARKDVIFKAGQTDSVQWKVELKNKTKTDYQWQATFFLNDGTKTDTPLKTATDQTLIPELSAAAAAGGN